MNRRDLLKAAAAINANLLITGEAYVISGDADNDFGKEAFSVPTNWIVPKHDGEPFSSYLFKTPSMSEAIPLPKEAVKRLYIPDPSDPIKGCMSPPTQSSSGYKRTEQRHQEYEQGKAVDASGA